MTKLFNLNGGTEITTLDGDFGFYVVTVDSEGVPVQSGFVTLATLKTFINTDPSVVPSSNPWRGALVYKTSAASVANNTAFNVPFDTENYDTDSIWSIGSPTRLTVPTGVTKVRLSGLAYWPAAAGSASISIIKNGATAADAYVGQGSFRVASASSSPLGPVRVQAQTAVISVTAGDYFEMRVVQIFGSTTNLEANSWFQMEILEASS